ncbi:hypothetical protein ACFLVW_04060 [Chloroflexota bacterium]
MVFPFTSEEHRRYGVVLKLITGIIAALLTIFFVWFEFDVRVFHSPWFWAILVFWGFFGWLSFLNAWERAGDNEAAEKVEDKLDGIKESIDRLVNEIRQDRDERNKL